MFDIVQRNPHAVHLEVHLEDHCMVSFQEGEEHSTANREQAGTKLTEWSVAYQKHPGAHHIPFDQFPRYFTLKNSSKRWKQPACLCQCLVSRRQPTSSSAAPAADRYDFNGSGADITGSIYAASSQKGELYHLPLLLTQPAGATCFENLRTLDGHQCGSSREACVKKDLLADYSEWKRALRQIFRCSFLPLSHLLATILLQCEPPDPRNPWEQHLSMFLQRIRARYCGMMQAVPEDERASSYALLEVQKGLQEIGGTLVSLCTYCLPTPKDHLLVLRAQAPSPQQVQSGLQETLEAALPFFNDHQRPEFTIIFGSILPSVSAESLQGFGSPSTATNTTTRMSFVTAPGGARKNFLSNSIQATLHLRGKSILTVAISALAAILLEGNHRSGFPSHSPLRAHATSESTFIWPIG